MGFGRYLKQVGKNIKGMRIQRGLTQQDVSSQSGLSYRHYQNIEAGKVNVTLETLFRLSMLFRTSVQELILDD
jgi:transcriptional regulator with XRE-family HTH domain